MLKNKINTVKIEQTEQICPDIKKISFRVSNKDFNPKPGQFLMIWVPGVDEIPMSISNFTEEGICSFYVKNVGECTNALHEMNEGDYIGFRGPLGNWFELPKGSFIKIFIVAGGIGIAPLLFLSSELHKRRIPFTLIEGGKVKNDLIFSDDFQDLDKDQAEIFYCTDDGSYGIEGFASDAFESVLKNYSQKTLSNAFAYTCGPEKMMYSIFKICERHQIKLQASLERIMRCGCGLCGLCSLDPTGLLVCKDGPVFKSAILRQIEDFGKCRRDFTGRKIELE